MNTTYSESEKPIGRVDEAIFKEIVEALDDAVFVHHGETGVVVYVNRAMLEMYGCKDLKEAVKMGPDVFSLGKYPYTSQEVQRHLKDVSEHGPKRFLWRSRRKDGTLFWTEVKLSVLKVGETRFFLAVVRDISPHLSQELKFDDLRNRYWSLLDNINKGVVAYQPVQRGSEVDFIITDINNVAAQLEKVRREDIIGKSVLDVFPGIKEFGLYDVFVQVYRTGAPQHFPAAFYCDDRIQGWRENFVYRLPSGEIVAVYEDRSREKEMENALQESEYLLRAIFDAVPAAICLVDMETRVFKWISTYIENITGYSAAELTGRTPRILYATEDEYRRVGKAYTMFHSRDLVDLETEFMHRDGSLVAIQLKAVKLKNDILCAIFDITDRKKAEEEMREMGRHLLRVQQLESLGVLAGGIAHDFNNLLMGIQGNAELLSMSEPGSQDIARYTDAIRKATAKAAALCRHMLTFAGKGKLSTERINLSSFVEDLREIIHISVSKNARLEFQLHSGIPDILADPDQIRQMIMNLIINASEAIGDATGTIKIATGVSRCPETSLNQLYDEADASSACVYIVVRDNGCGMDESVRKRIFEPFFTTKFAGRGLGMAAVHGIVTSHGGSIEIQSEPGHGTTVCIFLPVEPVDVKVSPHLPVDVSQVPTILVVDDESYVREVAEEMLKMGGYEVITAGSGNEAVDIYSSHSSEISCIILDYTMPEIGGSETFKRLKEIKPDVKIIISSGHDPVEVMREFREGEVEAFLPKPYRYGQLHKIIADALND